MKDYSAFFCLALFVFGFIILFVLEHLYCPECVGDLIMLASISLGLFDLDLPGH